MVMMEQVNLDEWTEKSMKTSDYDEADGMKQEVDSKDLVMHIEMSDLFYDFARVR